MAAVAEVSAEAQQAAQSQAVAIPAPAPLHPLHKSWTLWYDRPQGKTTQDTWQNSLKVVYTFDNVEAFWALWVQLTSAAEIQTNANYHLFQEGVRPAWEDPSNNKGGKWVVTLKDKKSFAEVWLFTILAVIGEDFDRYSDQICGCVCSSRKKGDRISLWTKEATDEAACMAIGGQFKAIANLPAEESIGYQTHAVSIKQNRSFQTSDRYKV
eukprot:c46286_g1_i1.p2 GENE.c46286_g1_i1~~c46286_g1_i1.p2  ORF type:complete len:211 (-),score=40.36 c46286_g1_i1:45-677(-)